jgi:NAD(P) transhydrogenase subunit alpha
MALGLLLLQGEALESSTLLLVTELTIFVLAIFLGFELITKVPPTLHTPLMSGANAISGITLVGALYCAQTGSLTLANLMGFLAIACATVNVIGGFMVTDRMLKMFGKKR